MAPSRDRLLHFGFKATVSDRGREAGWLGRTCANTGYWEATRLKGLGGPDSSGAWWGGACCLSREGRGGGLGGCVLSGFLLSLRSASTRALAPAPQPLP